MTADDVSRLIRTYSRTKMADGTTPTPLRYSAGEVERLLPHRSPLLYVETVESVDFGSATIHCTRYLSHDDPLFSGHFPTNPIYPGCSLVESIGQCALCLYQISTIFAHHFQNNSSNMELDNPLALPTNIAPLTVSLTAILGAKFLGAVPPQRTVHMYAQPLGEIDKDDYFYRAIGQAIVEDSIVAVMAAEVLLG